MTFTSLDSMGKTSLMLDLISQRQRALGANIANVDTPGKKRMSVEDYMRGNKIEIGTVLG